MPKVVTIVGVGALGSHFLQFLRSEDVVFRVIDFDKVEGKNTMSQFHSKPGVGKFKVLALQQVTNLLWGMKISVISHKLTMDNDKALLADSDLIVDCLDNAEARKIVQRFVRKNKIPCLHGAVDGNGSYGKVAWDEVFTIEEGIPVGTPTCEDGEFLPFIVSVSSFMARTVQSFLRDGKKRNFVITPVSVMGYNVELTT